MTKTKLVVAVVLAVLGVVIVLQNTAIMETRLLFITVQMPQSFLLLLTLALGFIVGLLCALAISKRKKRT